MILQATSAAAAPPAGGAETTQIVIATLGAGLATAALMWLVLGHRAGRISFLQRAAERSARASGLPGWSILPAAAGGIALVVALLGMYWDIALHIDNGRDAGPLANPAHYLILVGLFGIFSAGVVAMALPSPGERPGPRPVRLSPGWEAPVGGVLMAACGAFALIGFPLDDMWHRLFGQDVTLWGPTHLMLIGGAGMTLVGQAVLVAEGMSATGRHHPKLATLRRVGLMGGFLIGLSTFQAEFDFGVPQYRAVFQPLLIALAAGGALVAARLWIGRGGALAAVAFFLLIRGAVAVLVGPVFGQTTPAVPLYVVEALCVEAAAVALARRPLALGAVSGALIGTVGFAAEWGWSAIVMPLPWTVDLLPEGVVMAVLAGMAGGVAGALLGCGLRGELPRPATARMAVGAAGAVLAACLANGLAVEEPPGARATVAIAEDGHASVRVEPKSLMEDAAWATVTAWQGGGLRVVELDERGRSREPVPASGDWKAIVRVHKGRAVLGAPLYMPADAAIPAAELPAPGAGGTTRDLVRDTRILQRERRGDVPGWIWTAGQGGVLALWLAFLAALAWGVGRIGRAIGAIGGLTEPPRPETTPGSGGARRRAPTRARPA